MKNFKAGDKVRLVGRTMLSWLVGRTTFTGSVQECSRGIVAVDWDNHPWRTKSFELVEDIELVQPRVTEKRRRVIELAVANPTLSMAAIARHVGCSESLVATVFDEHGDMISDRVRVERHEEDSNDGGGWK